ncbi:MAG: methyltransferase [Rhizomicrobium sp.]|jgi:predicted nicotinamide N-methyase
MITEPSEFIRQNTALLAPPLVPEIVLHLATEVVPLWRQTEEELEAEGVPPPYWAFAWAGGQALARYVLDHPEVARGKRVLDFGSGSGLLSIAAAKCGATHVTATDIDVFAAAAIALNCGANGVKRGHCDDIGATREIAPLPLRERRASEDGLLGPDAGEEFARLRAKMLSIVTTDVIGSQCIWDVILVGDMCYERPLAERLLAWLTVCVAGGATVLLGDPGRSYFPKSGVTPLDTFRVQTTRELEDREIRETTVYRFTPDIRPGAGPT